MNFPRHRSILFASLAAVLMAAPLAISGAAQPEEPANVTLDPELEPWRGDLAGMFERRVIRALVPYSKTLYFVDLGGRQRGMSYDFMHAFEQHLNRNRKPPKLRIYVAMIPVARDELLTALVQGRGDVAAANLTVTLERQALADFTIPLARGIRELIVTGPGAPQLTSLDDLSGKEVFVRADSSYHDSLLALNRGFQERKLPPAILRDAPGHFETEDTLEMANAGLVKIVVADEYIANLWKRIYPNIVVHEHLAVRENADIAYAVRKHSPQLMAELNAFSKTHRQGTLFGNVTLQKYLEQTRWVKSATSPGELKRFLTLVDLFQKYGERYRVDWLLMAAQGYQESQLNQDQRSPAGAIGIMQVMPATGKQMRVGDITQLEPNIHAGVKYVRHLIDEYFADASIDDMNKTLFAFAAYNAGPSRIRELRREAQKSKLDPNVWFNNVERVVARRVGQETVQYVANVYKYYFAYSQVRGNVREEVERAQAK